jgi:MoxR-like ATPase
VTALLGESAPTEHDVASFRRLHQRLAEAVEVAVQGKRAVVDLVLVSAFASGHVLLEDVPGTGKTTLARAVAKALGGDVHRVQFTPDLLPSDVTGRCGSVRGLSSRTWCWPTRSTGPPPRPSRPCWR